MVEEKPTGSCPPPAILVVDDDALFREILSQALTLEGYGVLEAQDGLQGVRVFAESKPAIVLLDLLMPAKEGIETLREMKKLDPTAIIFTMTGGEWGENNNRAARLLGARRAFLKPLRLSELLEAIREELPHPPGTAKE